MSDIDLAALADQFLDDELDQAAWEIARANHGPALDQALTRARAVRSALCGLSRPELPPDLRQRLLAEAPHAKTTPEPLALPRSTHWWRIALPAALAAMLLVVVMLTRQPTHSATLAPAVARQESKADAESQDLQHKDLRSADKKTEMLEKTAAGSIETAQDDLKEMSVAPAMSLLTDEEREKNATDVVVTANRKAKDLAAANGVDMDGNLAPTNITEEQQRAGFAAPVVAAPAAPAAMAAKAAAPIATPVIIAARWHSARDAGERDAAPAENKAQADRLRRDVGGAATPAKPLAPAQAAMAEVAAAEAAPQADDQRLLRITLRNSGSDALHLIPGSVVLVGIANSGRTLWKTPLQRDLTIPAGDSVTWDEPVPVIPPGGAQLRIEAQGAKSANILP